MLPTHPLNDRRHSSATLCHCYHAAPHPPFLASLLVYSNYLTATAQPGSCGASVGKANRLSAERIVVRNPAGARDVSSPKHVERIWGPKSLVFNRCNGSFPGIKRPGREADHSSGTKVKNEWSCTSVPPIYLH